jgi:hypothetical protein
MTGQVLTSWKEIAAYLGKGVRTVQRWEAEMRLPVRRPGPERHIVIAFPAELDEWVRQGAVGRNGNGNGPSLLKPHQGLTQQFDRHLATTAELERLRERMLMMMQRLVENRQRTVELVRGMRTATERGNTVVKLQQSA